MVLDRIVDAELDEPAEQQIELQPSMSCRSERIELNACSSIAGAIDGRPMPE